MQKFITLFVFILLSACTLSAQDIITVEPPGGGASATYLDLQVALDAAPVGSKVLVSGGKFNGEININKRVHLIGAGFEVDSTLSTKRTILDNINLQENSSGTVIEGVDVLGSLSNQPSPNGTYPKLANISIRYSRIGVITFTQYNNNPTIDNVFINNSIISNISIFGVRGVKVSNSMFNTIEGINGEASIENNLISAPFRCLKNTVIKNNIIWQTYYVSGCGTYYGGNYFQNNVFVFSQTNHAYDPANDTWQGNKFSVGLPTIFTNYNTALFTGNIHLDYKLFDFHIKSGSAADNAGTDGTDCGIYGGPKPWKEGAVPSNPHIQTKTIAPETDAQGKLNVNIRVKAQGN